MLGFFVSPYTKRPDTDTKLRPRKNILTMKNVVLSGQHDAKTEKSGLKYKIKYDLY